MLMELLSAGAARWACQLPGASLTSSALDLAALGGHMEVRRGGGGQEEARQLPQTHMGNSKT